MTYRDYKSFWDNFLHKWHSNHDDFVQNDLAGRAFFPRNSSGKVMETDLYKNISCMPEPYYFGEAFSNAASWQDFDAAVVVLDLNPGLSHDADSLKSKNSPYHPILDDLAKGNYSTVINSRYSPFISTNPTIPGVTWWKSKRLAWFSRFLSTPDVREKIFAVELCPFHSKSWNVKLSPEAIDFVKNYVLSPVAKILGSNKNVRLGYCFGKDWENIFHVFGFEKVAQWGVNYPGKPLAYPDGSEAIEDCWPKTNSKINNKEVPTNRIYTLFRGNIDGIEVNFLCLRASGTFAAPGKEFEDAEKQIKKDLINLFSISL